MREGGGERGGNRDGEGITVGDLRGMGGGEKEEGEEEIEMEKE